MIEAPHFGFVVAAYAFAAAITVGMIVAILWDYRGLRDALRRLETARSESEAL
jgi:heme exporter protein CcmD